MGPIATSPKSSSGIQNEKLAESFAANPDRFVAFATVAMQHPELAVQQLEYGVKKLGLRGMSVGTHVDGEELSDPKFHPIWQKCEELGLLVFMHPIAYGPFEKRFAGNGGLVNIIGNPLDTTIALTHMIFEGTLDRFPGLKLCASHAGGYIGVLWRPLRRRLHHLPGPLQGGDAEEEADRVSQGPLLRHHHLQPRGVALSRVAGRGEPDHARHRLSVPVVEGGATADIILNTPGLSDDDKRAMLGGSAAKLLGINI